HANDFEGAKGDEKSPERRAAASRAWHEYQPADVPYAEKPFPDDITIYRKFRFGKHLELFLTDERYYRSDHVIPQGPADILIGNQANSAIGARYIVLKSALDEREAQAHPTMLGDRQREWLLEAVRNSSATWKFWGSETQVAQMILDLSEFAQLPSFLRTRFYL